MYIYIIANNTQYNVHTNFINIIVSYRDDVPDGSGSGNSSAKGLVLLKAHTLVSIQVILAWNLPHSQLHTHTHKVWIQYKYSLGQQYSAYGNHTYLYTANRALNGKRIKPSQK